MVGTAGAAEVLAIVKRKRIAAMICNPKLSADDVIDFSRSRAAFAEHGNAAKRIIEKDGRDGVLAPVFRVVELLESKLSALRIAGAEETDLAIVFLMSVTVRGTRLRQFRTVAADAASGFGHLEGSALQQSQQRARLHNVRIELRIRAVTDGAALDPRIKPQAMAFVIARHRKFVSPLAERVDGLASLKQHTNIAR
jgi:hypothetical protein